MRQCPHNPPLAAADHSHTIPASSLFWTVCFTLVHVIYGFALPTEGKQISSTPNSHKSHFLHQPTALQPHQRPINGSTYQQREET